jgi:hypothetical protein
MPHIGHGDAIVCLPIFKYYAEQGIETKVILPQHSISLLSSLYGNSNLEFVALEIAFKDTMLEGRSLPTQARIYGRKIQIPVLYLGYELLAVYSVIRPDLDFNSVFYKIARVPLQSKDETIYSDVMHSQRHQFSFPSSAYALVDHFPGSIREIPSVVIDDIQSRGLEVVYNPREVPYLQLAELIENATELHFVNSSFFCLSLFLKPRAESKNIYLMRHGLYHGLGFYDLSWDEWVLNNHDGQQLEAPERVDVPKLIQDRRILAQSFWRRAIDNVLFGRVNR